MHKSAGRPNQVTVAFAIACVLACALACAVAEPKPSKNEAKTDPNGGKNRFKRTHTEAKITSNCICIRICTCVCIEICFCKVGSDFGRLPVRKPHVLPRIFQNLDGRLKRKSGEKKSLRAISTEKMAQWVLIWSLQCSKKWIFEDRLLKVGFQKCASRCSGEHIFVKIRKNCETRQHFLKEMCV